MSQVREASIAKIAEASAKLSPTSMRRLLDYALMRLDDVAVEKVAGMATMILQQSQGKRQSRNARMAKPLQEDWRIGR